MRARAGVSGEDAGTRRVAVAGGALQGLEITYLARKAGYETLLLDKRKDVPATGICHEFVHLDLTDHKALTRALPSVDMVLPATENTEALGSLAEWCREHGIPLAFDGRAYAVSSSKAASDTLFENLEIPAPGPWPHCAFPVLAKPDGGSGSKGIQVFRDRLALEGRFGATPPRGWVLQEYLKGPSFSIEVLGRPGAYGPLQITALEMGEDHDCKRVVAPAGLPPHLERAFREMAVSLAEALGLWGIMDVEAILHEGRLKVLEIDARFPSQTPMAVYHSTDVNMLEILAKVIAGDPDGVRPTAPPPPKRASILEHIRVRPGRLSVEGEGMMAGAGPLHLEEGFFGVHEALTNYTPGRGDWAATLMVRGADMEEARAILDQAIHEIRTRYDLGSYLDRTPPDPLEQGE